MKKEMNDKPLISIANNYNGEKYVKEAIDSVFSQTYKNWEIIFIDNCSTDTSAKIAKSYDKEKLKYYKTEYNLQLGAARNWGMKFVNGDFLSFLDTDDIWLTEKLEFQLNIIKEDIAFVYGPVIQINENGDKLRETKVNKIKFQIIVRRYDITHSTMINLKLVMVNFNENLSYCPDYELFMKIVFDNNKFISANRSLVNIGSIRTLYAKKKNIQMKEIMSILDQFKNNTFVYRKYKKVLIHVFINLIIY